MGLREPDEQQAHAVFLSAAAVAEAALRDGPEQFRPSAGSLALVLQDTRAQLRVDTELWHDKVGGTDDACIMRTLLGVSANARASKQTATTMRCSAATKPATWTDSALSRACAPAHAVPLWLHALPICAAPARHGIRLRCTPPAGLAHMPSNAPAVHCFCRIPVQPGNTDHEWSAPPAAAR